MMTLNALQRYFVYCKLLKYNFSYNCTALNHWQVIMQIKKKCNQPIPAIQWTTVV